MTDANDGQPMPEPQLQTSGVAAPPAPPGVTTVGDAGGSKPSRAPLTAVLVVVLALVGAGAFFLTKDERPTATELIAASEGAVAESKTAKMKLTLDAQLAMMGQEIGIDATADGLVSFDGGPASLHFVMNTDLGAMGGGAGPQNVSFDMITADDVVYLRVPAERRDQTDGKEWVKAAAEDLTDVLGRTGGTVDPKAFVNYIEKLDGVEELAEDEVRGTATRHFKGSITLEELAGEQGATTPEAREQFLEQFAKLGITTVPVEAWIDSDGRPRKIVTTMTGSPDTAGSGQGSTFSLTNTLELFDYGTKERVVIPKDADVYEADSLEIQNLLIPQG